MELRKPLFIAALVLLGLCVLVEVGASILLPRPVASRADIEANLRSEDAQDDVSVDEVLAMQRENPPTPGLGIPYLALLDGLLLLTLGSWAPASHPRARPRSRPGTGDAHRLHRGAAGRYRHAHGAIGLLLLMVGLFTAVPFGTIAYLAVWGFFNRGGAAATLGLLMAAQGLAAGVASCWRTRASSRTRGWCCCSSPRSGQRRRQLPPRAGAHHPREHHRCPGRHHRRRARASSGPWCCSSARSSPSSGCCKLKRTAA